MFVVIVSTGGAVRLEPARPRKCPLPQDCIGETFAPLLDRGGGGINERGEIPGLEDASWVGGFCWNVGSVAIMSRVVAQKW